MKNWINALLLVVLLGLTACSNLPAVNSNEIKENTWYPIENILDNNTFEINAGNHIEQVTFLSLDVVSINHEYLGDTIHEFLVQELTNSKEVNLTFDEQKRNERGQLQAIVKLRNDSNLNELLLENGYAKLLIIEPNIKMENVYKKFEQTAKSTKVGIWSDEQETSNVDVALKETPYKGIRLFVSKTSQKVLISNYTSQNLDLRNWKLVSVLGNQIYFFEDIILEPGEKIAIYSTDTEEAKEDYSLYWGQDHVWDLTEQESAELYNANNELIAEWKE